MTARETLQLILVKPTRYDSDGYAIRWARSLIPSNSLAVVHSLVEDCRQRHVLGADVEIELVTIDDTNRNPGIDKIVRNAERRGIKCCLFLVGVQSNQFPRAVDLARPFTDRSLPVIIGGFHVSGCVAMLPDLPDDLRWAQDMGISFFIGEAENGRLDEVLADAYAGKLKPSYDHMDNLPDLGDQPPPVLPREIVLRTASGLTSFDLGRGCPFQCSFCTIINVQGRKSRSRSPDDLERIVRANAEQGIKHFFLTDDNFARNSEWEPLLDRLIQLRRTEGLEVDLMIQVDTLCHRIPDFISKCVEAGVRRVFIGLENINPANLLEAKKRQNKITEYRTMLQDWKSRGVVIYAGYIIGFPADTKESVLRDVDIIKRELAVDILEFFYLTPLPGSEDHKNMVAAGTWMDEDLNKYNLCNRVTHHGQMSDTEWEDAYDEAWRTFFSSEHMKTVARRNAAMPVGWNDGTLKYMLEFKLLYEGEGLHPLEGGIVRLKSRRDRRHGLPIEAPYVFYPKLIAEYVRKHLIFARAVAGFFAIKWQVRRERQPDLADDLALRRVEEDGFDDLEMFQQTNGGDRELRRIREQNDLIAAAKSNGRGTGVPAISP